MTVVVRSNFVQVSLHHRTRFSPCESPNAIQTVYDSLASIPSHAVQCSVNNPQKCAHLKQALEAMNSVTLSDLGFNDGDIDHLDESVCAHVAVSNDFHIAVFLIPKGGSLPLHDHPTMSVLSKVVRGRVSVKAYSFVKDECEGVVVKNGALAARQDMNCVKSSNDPSWFLSPTEGNIHEFTAETSCVILDCLLPPYYDPDRPCNFYKSEFDSQNQRVWLRPCTQDHNNLPHNVEYPGIRPVMKRPSRSI